MKKLSLILFLILSYCQFCLIRGQDEYDYEDYDAEDDDDIVYVHYPINRCPEHVKAHFTAFINTIRWEKGVEPVHLNSRLNAHAHELTKSKNRPKPDDDESVKSYTWKTEIGPFNGMIFEVDVSEALDNLSDEDIANRDFKWIGVGCKTSYRKNKRWIHLAVVLGGMKDFPTSSFSNPVKRIEFTSKLPSTTNSTKIEGNDTSNSNSGFSTKTFLTSIPPVLNQTSDNEEDEEISAEPTTEIDPEISTPILVNEIAVTENLNNSTELLVSETDEFETTSDASTSSSQLPKSLTNASVSTIQS